MGSGTGTGTGIAGGYTEGYTGVLPSQLAAKPSPPASDHRERALPQAGWAGSRGGRTLGTADGDGPGTTLRARSVPLAPPCTRTLQMSASGPITARFDLISYILSQNRGVSPKYVEKA